MLELIQITNDPAFARRCDALGGFRLFVDLERMGKAERQAGRNTFISAHRMEDVRRVKEVLLRSPVMVRVNPLNQSTAAEVEAALAQGADQLMLPMFTAAAQLREFLALVAGRVPVVALLETGAALASLDEWITRARAGRSVRGTQRPAPVAWAPLHVRTAGARGWWTGLRKRPGARACVSGSGALRGWTKGSSRARDVLAEHLRLGSGSVILSRTFHRGEDGTAFEAEVAKLRRAEEELAARSQAQIDADARRIAAVIGQIAAGAGRAA